MGTVAETGHLAHLFLDRTARRWDYIVTLREVPEGFRTETGFVRRRGITDLWAMNRVSWYGRPGARLERLDLRNRAGAIWEEGAFWRAGGAVEGGANLQLRAEMRGNLEVEATWMRDFYTLDGATYAGYTTGAAAGHPPVEGGRMGGLDGFTLSASSSRWRWLSIGAGAGTVEVPVFAEGVRGREWGFDVEAALRPTEALRVDARLRRSVLHRARDGSRYSDAIVPRLRVEYQLSRAVAVRALAQYAVEEVDLLRAPDGTPYLQGGQPFRLRRGERPGWEAPQLNPARLDLLFSYRPSPGTLVFLGYGREAVDDEAFRFRTLAPRSDGVFFKVSYLFRS